MILYYVDSKGNKKQIAEVKNTNEGKEQILKDLSHKFVYSLPAELKDGEKLKFVLDEPSGAGYVLEDK